MGRTLVTSLVGVLVFLGCHASITESKKGAMIVVKGAKQHAKYRDPKQPIEVRIKDLLGKMSLEEKVGQMTQLERQNLTADIMKNYFIGSVLSGGGSPPRKNASIKEWVDMVNDFQNAALATRLGIPMIYGIDSVHGQNNVVNATIFPHNVGLGVMRLELQLHLKFEPPAFLMLLQHALQFAEILDGADVTESYSEDHKIVQEMTQIIEGLQGDVKGNMNGMPSVLHGKTKVAGFFGIHMPAYLNSLEKGVSTVMASYSSINGVKMHANRDLLTGLLKEKLGFKGFVISDWEGIDRITYPPKANYTYSIQASILAGVDMVMVPYNQTEFINGLLDLVKKNVIPMSRIDDAVTGILRVKFAMGLFENPLGDYSLIDQVGCKKHRELAKEAVRKSLVLLKNGKPGKPPVLPLPKNANKILVAGTHAHILGYQCGGWTIEWQGAEVANGHVRTGTTILNAIKATVDKTTQVTYRKNPGKNFFKKNNFDYAIVAVGCPVVLEPHLKPMDALVAAWLPGSESQGVADVLFGDYGSLASWLVHGLRE
ncbi:hypothetical protein REPUB_Repub19eG0086500 [Reevesia pubescens]